MTPMTTPRSSSAPARPIPLRRSGPPRSAAGWAAKRVLLFIGAGLVSLYLLGATGGFLFVRYVRKNETISFVDVALLRWREVRRGMAAQQFEKAQKEWDAGNFQVAFLAYNFAVNNDPGNVPGILAAARFLQAAGSNSMALATLEAGLVRAPDDARLIERTFSLLNTVGRDRRTLELLRQRPASAFGGPNGAALRTFELEATLNLGDVEGAKQLLAQHPELARTPRAVPVVARVLWESKQRLKAIETLSAHVRGGPESYEPYAQLAQWLLTAEMGDDAVRTAEAAVAKFPKEVAPRILLVEAQGVRTNRGREFNAAVEAFLKDYGDRPEEFVQLASLAGRRGWVELARGLYDLGALRQAELSGLGFCYADALLRQSRFKEVLLLLAQIEAQALDAGSGFLVQLRNRQIIATAGVGDAPGVREAARRLAGALRNDGDALELYRRTFLKLGIVDAAAELSGRATPVRVAADMKQGG